MSQQNKRSTTDRQGPGSKRVRSQESETESLVNCSPAVPGCILKIELQNFMCHTYFEVELSQTVNFIVGRNGSGKSAILMALVIGLGGKSSATNRAPNMTEFIKQGSSWGQVAITICNSNAHKDAWEWDLYGSSVIVERRITKKGSTYKLKTSEGKTISTLKKDLTLLLDNYNIQVNNPVSILNQEMSKRFLASTDPSDKYKFFMKSTHLEQMILDYQQVNEKLETIKHTIKKKEMSVPDVRAQVRHLQNQYNEITELRDLGKKVSQYKDELIWSKVKEIEEELIPIERSIEKIKSTLPAVEEKICDSQERYNEAEAAVKTIETETTAEMTKYERLESDQASLRQLSQAKKRLLWEIVQEKKKIQRSIKETDSDKTHLLQRIKEIQDCNKARNIEAEKESRESELAECRVKQTELTDNMTATTSTMEDLERRLSNMNDDGTRIREDIEQTDGEIRKLNDRLKTQDEAKKNRVRVFGRFMPELLKRIQEADKQGRFHKKPRGPFGLHIKVKDAKWATIVELAIGSSMTSFVVSDQHDKTVLLDMFRQSCQNRREWPNMIMMKFRDDYYDVTPNKPSSSHPTLYDMLDIHDNMISNALVEQFKMEQCLLIESSEEARTLIVGHAPRNVVQAWTLTGDDVRDRGAYSNDLSKRSAQYFQNDPSLVIEELKNKIRSLREQNSLQRQNRSATEKEVNAIRGQYTTERNKQTAIKKKLSTLRSRIIELDNVEDAPLLDATAMEDEVSQYDDQIKDYNRSLAEHAQKEVDYKEEYEAAKKRHADSIERDSSITNKLEELKNKLHEGQRLVTQRHDQTERLKSKKKLINAEQKKFVTEKAAKETEISEAQGMALQRCERVDTRRPAKDLEQQIRNMEARIKQGNKSSVNVEDITRRFHDAKTKYEEIKATVLRMKSFSKSLESTLNNREKRYFLFRKEISTRMNFFFMMNLSQRGYSGKLEVDHERRQLKMQLNVDTSGTSQETHDVRTLSGGERSFSTVCFICSLWNIMESPFRCLDEFDVFMDLYNRRITMNLLMEHASQTPKQRQYILFTPQDMSTFSKKFKNIKILQLAAPERNNAEADA